MYFKMSSINHQAFTVFIFALMLEKEARKAIADAMPFLVQAEQVTILVVDAAKHPECHGQEPGADLALAWRPRWLLNRCCPMEKPWQILFWIKQNRKLLIWSWWRLIAVPARLKWYSKEWPVLWWNTSAFRFWFLTNQSIGRIYTIYLRELLSSSLGYYYALVGLWPHLADKQSICI